MPRPHRIDRPVADLTEAERQAEIARLTADQMRDDTNRIVSEKVGGERTLSLDAPIDQMVGNAVVEMDNDSEATLKDRLMATVERLPEPQQALLNLLFWERVTEREAAYRLGISQTAVCKRRNSALTSLRRELGVSTLAGLIAA